MAPWSGTARLRSARGILAFGALAIALVSMKPLLNFPPLIVFNGSASAPIGFYRVRIRDIERGDLVLVRTPESIGKLLAERRYLPPSVPLIKRVAGLPGDEICRRQADISINGSNVATALRQDNEGHSMPVWSGCRCLGEGEFFFLQHHPRSFDSRYFGPVRAEQVIGIIEPLWLFELGDAGD